MSTLHCAPENETDLCVNERQKIRHYRARSILKKEEERMPNRTFFYFARTGAYIRKLRYSSDVIYTLIRLEISHKKTRWWCLKCVIVYLVRNIPAFVMYCVYGASRSSLLIESPDSMMTTDIQ